MQGYFSDGFRLGIAWAVLLFSWGQSRVLNIIVLNWDNFIIIQINHFFDSHKKV